MALVNHKGAEVDLVEVEVLVLDMVNKVDMEEVALEEVDGMVTPLEEVDMEEVDMVTPLEEVDMEEVDMEEVDMALAEVEGGLAQ